jgi:hypothetical protein
MNTNKIRTLKNSPVMPITRFYTAIHVTKYLALVYLCKARILNGQFVSHAIMFVANKLVKEVSTGMGAKYAKPSRRREKNLPAI